METLVLLISSYLALFYVVIIFMKKEKHISDIYLAIWLILLSGYMLVLSAQWYHFDTCLSFLYFVFLYFYIASITQTHTFKARHLLHFLPFVMVCATYVFFPSIFIRYHLYIMILLFVCCIVYFFLMELIIYNYRRFSNMNYSTSDRADLSWIKLLLYCAAATYLVAFAGYVLHLTIGTRMRPVFLSFVLFLLVNAVGLRGIKKNSTFVVRFLPNPSEDSEAAGGNAVAQEEEDTPNKTTDSTYHNYGLKPADAQLLAEKLKTHMSQHRPYINPDLCLRDLAEQLGVYPHYVTQVLNTLFNQNFYDFVNTYRVEEAKKLLRGGTDKSGKMPILTIAYNCGFNSKSSFNRIFKQKIGLTPSLYREENTEVNQV
jgi:AraC-like DNA-binding protein